MIPVASVTDLSGWLRRKLGMPQSLKPGSNLRYWALGLALLLSPVAGVAAFEWISPIGIMHRGLIFGFGFGWVVIAGIYCAGHYEE